MNKSIAPAEADLRMNYGLLVWPSASNPHHLSLLAQLINQRARLTDTTGIPKGFHTAQP